mmetsp:Transcript_34840/g.109407  ORF Transcript_34840/g.109407 Transcript_34840/m.109407 type:complete len:161 (-) Transcript_34840:179-661(-)|eukprot:CAMPEP_0118874102 /NCGR_PEP_ID=MMETSP1163-20130328/15674_1 /TAXON_ID=124430 /ORGANISM="Phaeomonas parva, Strain CCMP2877" /LENGTH=160 /DNA_ID=CAMNT_0006809455 /DNA_START=182 /DNA_END=664 /DNA_ORIENTATION=-
MRGLQLLLAAAALTAALAFKAPATRRGAAQTAALWFVGAGIAQAGTPTVQNVEALGEKAHRLREAVRKNGPASKMRAEKELETVLKPLQAAMEVVAGSNKEAKTQALLMKGHMLELNQALKANDWKPYTSKTTGETYPGGKPERELEEVEETLEDYLRVI